MVSQLGSRDRILAAASSEFAARGFDGAKVDRIAARARVNKAMVYYHFASKAALYREILRQVFGGVAAAVQLVRDAGGSAETQLAGFIDAVNSTALANPQFPPIWLREMADAGRHLDRAVVHELTQVVATLAAILEDGVREERFRPAHPLLVQLGIVGPLLLFAASAPVRQRFRHVAPAGAGSALLRDAIVAQVKASTLAGLAPTATASRRDR
jgi:TetR/AcrR family transcriptional regulator